MKAKQQITQSDYRKLSDEELVHRYAHRHENAAINCLYERYGHIVFGICLEHYKNAGRAREATEQIFIGMLDDFRKYQIDTFKPWLFRTVHTFCLMQTTNSVPVANNEIAVPTALEFEDVHTMDDDHLPELLDVLIQKLDKEQRTCLEMFYMQKLSYAAIAAKANYSPLQVKNYIQKAKLNLKHKLQEAFRYVKP